METRLISRSKQGVKKAKKVKCFFCSHKFPETDTVTIQGKVSCILCAR